MRFQLLDDAPAVEEGPNTRRCDHCNVVMTEGYCIDGGANYYCTDPCLYANMTEAEYLDLYDDGEGDTYWTTWDEEDDE